MEVGDLKLKTTINGKRSTVIGTPAEVAEFLEVARKKAIRRAVDALPRPVKLGEGEPVMAQINGQVVERKTGPIHVKDAFKPKFNAISQTREEIVKEAITDVAELLKGEYYDEDGAVFRHVGGIVDFVIRESDRVNFYVNRKKGVVVANLVIMAVSMFNTKTLTPGKVATTGIARCAPSDVFNEHVGKAIALRRALGLPVPAKYYEVGGSAPEGKQVGDVAIYTSGIDGDHVVTVVDGHVSSVRGGEIGVSSSLAIHAKVIDDSARYVAPSTPAAKVVYVD